MNIFCKIFIIFFVLFFATTSMAGEYEATSGHTVRVSWKQKGSRLKVWGQILKGSKCKRLDLRIDMVNSENNDRAYIRDKVVDLNKPGARFSGKDKVIPSNSKYDITSKYHWHVDNILGTCSN